MSRYICKFEHRLDDVKVSLPGTCPDASSHEAQGETVGDAICRLLPVRTAAFASDADELESCVAALRGRHIVINVEDRRIRSLGLI